MEKQEIVNPAAWTSDTNSESRHSDVDRLAEERRVKRKVDMTVLPLLFLGLLIFQLDRMNLGSALTAGFGTDVGIDQSTVNVGNQLMFAGIVLLEIPSQMLLQKLGPRIYLPTQVLVFGIIATMQCLIKNRTGFLLVKSFLGLSEAGYIPGGIFTISTWYTRKERAKRVALFFFGMFGGNALSPLLASGILQLEGKLGLRGWQWIFLLEGIFTIIIAASLLLFLPGSPEHPTPLFVSRGLIHITPADGLILQQRIADETLGKVYRSQHEKITPAIVWKTVCHWQRWPHFFATSLIFSTWSPLTTYHPSIIMSLGFNRISANALASIGPFMALAVLFFFAYLSDHTNRRGLVVFIAIICYLITLIVARITVRHASKWGRWGIWTAVNAFSVGYHPAHNTWMQLNCSDPAERSVSIALWVMFANTGVMYGTQYFQGKDKQLYQTGLTIMISAVSMGAVLVVAHECIYWWWNRKLRAENQAEEDESKHTPLYVM